MLRFGEDRGLRLHDLSLPIFVRLYFRVSLAVRVGHRLPVLLVERCLLAAGVKRAQAAADLSSVTWSRTRAAHKDSVGRNSAAVSADVNHSGSRL
jgi:hypothetical protein